MNKNIYTSITNSNFGKTLIAKTDKGLCAILFGETEEFLRNELIKLFPKSEISTIDDKDFVYNIVRSINDEKDNENLYYYKIDLCNATDFQKWVWWSLFKIPKGETRTYKEIAVQIGKPNAFRAVGTACAKNPIAVIIPCHRVVSKNDKIVNYRWGKEMKERLLSREKLSSR